MPNIKRHKRGSAVSAARQNIANNLGWYIQFQHILSGEKVSFQAFVTDYSDSYTQQWTPEDIFGRMDPLLNYGGTKRKITLAWDVVAADYGEARFNLSSMQLLAKMQYPTYTVNRQFGATSQVAGGEIQTQGGATNTINGAPLMRVTFTDLIKDQAGKVGLLCAMTDGLTFKPNLEKGFVYNRAGEAIPKIYSLNCSLDVLHEHELGWEGGGGSGTWIGANAFPYNVDNQATPQAQMVVPEGAGDTQLEPTPEGAPVTDPTAPRTANSNDIPEGNVTHAPNASYDVPDVNQSSEANRQAALLTNKLLGGFGVFGE